MRGREAPPALANMPPEEEAAAMVQMSPEEEAALLANMPPTERAALRVEEEWEEEGGINQGDVKGKERRGYPEGAEEWLKGKEEVTQ